MKTYENPRSEHGPIGGSDVTENEHCTEGRAGSRVVSLRVVCLKGCNPLRRGVLRGRPELDRHKKNDGTGG